MPDSHTVTARPKQFLLGQQPSIDSFKELNFELLGDLAEPFRRTLDEQGRVNLSALTQVLKRGDVKDALGVRVLESIASRDQPEVPSVLVVTMHDGVARNLTTAYGNRLVAEENAFLELLADGPEHRGPEMWLESEWRSGLTPQDTATFQFVVKRKATPNPPVANASVYLVGHFWFAKAVTGEDGTASLEFYGQTDSFLGLLVKPLDGYWSLWIDNPHVDANSVNEVLLTALGDEHPSVLAGFPEKEMHGWGQLAMNLDKAKEGGGRGVKIAVIDSGFDTSHADLKEDVSEGRDFTKEPVSSSSWNEDIVGHGTHVSGVITGLHGEVESGKAGVLGFAPEADIFVYKIFPGGRFSDLIKSLDRCVEHHVDVVNLSLGSQQESLLLHQKFQQARENGVACIAAAGNSGGAVMYPAKWPEVLAVSAIGKQGTFDRDSYHRRQVGEYQSGEYFTARFTCFGPEVDVCAPGVAVVSAVPTGPRGYASWDGTSMACPQVVGLAARILEARPEIRSLGGVERVDRLFQYIKEHARTLAGIPEEFQGQGLPDAVKALGEKPSDGENGEGDPWSEILECLRKAVRRIEEQVAASS